MPRFRGAGMICGYMAASADGYIADAGGGVGWLEAFNGVDTGYAGFIAGIDTVVMGRKTYDQVIGFDVGWPYEGKRCVVVTSSPLTSRLGLPEVWSAGLPALASELVEAKAWAVGGARLQADLIRLGALDWLDLFVMPVFLGAGVPLFPSEGPPQALALQEQESFEGGIQRLRYAPRT
ncbi:dihydrofolate reductase family protein [Pseudoruegeria sp. SHC-113]|uniref:dihydrofolate reductase family protein n=1 Tax=Pseudoruegeria sp. SHC-113 TaxID=2855439 RepID=UPI0021BAB1D1|nr:dihydrofolate reductase family protein [Pseudoruegeria sp. SHC-113]MCT8159045.1 dihydrofolate reductase family protein [Pseudoruegeria sp. SHC-113]